jgi:hypothetical protein
MQVRIILVRPLHGKGSAMKKGLPVACLTVMTAFCALPHLIGLPLPTLAIPEAQVASVVCAIAAFLAFVRLSRRPNRFGFVPVYALASLATLLSSLSWLGIPVIDAVFMLTGLASAIALLVQLGMIVTRAFKTPGSTHSVRTPGGS